MKKVIDGVEYHKPHHFNVDKEGNVEGLGTVLFLAVIGLAIMGLVYYHVHHVTLAPSAPAHSQE